MIPSNNSYITKLSKESFRLYKLGDLSGAKKKCREALRMESKNFDLLYLLASIELKLNNRTKAKEVMLKACEINPDDATLHNNLGIELSTLGEYDAALMHYKKALSLNPNFYWANNNIAGLLIQQKKYDEAIGFLNEAIKTESKYADAHFNLGVALQYIKDLQGAINSYQIALTLNPSLVQAKNNIELLMKKMDSQNQGEGNKS